MIVYLQNSGHLKEVGYRATHRHGMGPIGGKLICHVTFGVFDVLSQWYSLVIQVCR